jgi:hypothetical protein
VNKPIPKTNYVDEETVQLVTPGQHKITFEENPEWAAIVIVEAK